MQYSLSNTASLTLLHEKIGVQCKYPNIYNPKLKIDGLKEQAVSLITMEDPTFITQGVWGILPQDFDGEWKSFQKIKRTLHVKANEIYENALFNQAIEKRRCLIIVTGFYAYQLKGKDIQKFLVEKEPLEPFYLAGIYNVLEDGFVTCSVINVPTNELLKSNNNLYEAMPLQIPRILKNIWLDELTTKEKVAHIISKPYTTKLVLQKISS